MQQCTEINLLTLQKLIEKTTPQQKLNTVQQNITVWPFFLVPTVFVCFFGLARQCITTKKPVYHLVPCWKHCCTVKHTTGRAQMFRNMPDLSGRNHQSLSLDKTKQTRKNNTSAHKAIVMVSKYLLGWEITHKIILYSLHFPILSIVCLFGWALSIGKIWHLLHGKYHFKRCTGNNTGEFALINERGHLYEQLKWRERETCQSRTQMA